MKNLKTVVQLVGMALVTAAIVQEMKKPPESRTWHGRVADFVPYDFRVPTIEKFKEVYWNPESPNIISERVFGVGWGINLGRLFKLASECCKARGCWPEQGA